MSFTHNRLADDLKTRAPAQAHSLKALKKKEENLVRVQSIPNNQSSLERDLIDDLSPFLPTLRALSLAMFMPKSFHARLPAEEL